MWVASEAGKRSFKSHVPTLAMDDDRRGQKKEDDIENEGPPLKRPATIVVGSSFKWNLQALTNVADAVESGAKSPVSALNELGVNVTYTVTGHGGPAHCPSFTVTVKVVDMQFQGWGHSKRSARAAAARACLAALLARAGRVMRTTQPPDFTADVPDFPISEFQCLEANANADANASSSTSQPEAIQSTSSANDEPTAESEPPNMTPSNALYGAATNPETKAKSPINWLYENYPGLSFVCCFGDGSPLVGPQAPLQLSHSMRFKVSCQIEDKVFEGYGSSKKLAKLAAARSAVASLECNQNKGPGSPSNLKQPLADHVSKLVNEKFNELMKNDLAHSRRKVLAGIVLTIDNKTEGAKVIAVTTGTKCVSGEHMSVRGRSVNDSHAEVAARRCLLRYLYNQLLVYAKQTDPTRPNPGSVLEPVQGGGYRLRPQYQLHLYVSTAPCGDGRIFSPHDQDDSEQEDKHPNRQARGQLRTKIESGEGTIPVKNCTNAVQTWDGVMQGERLLTMSCSDKVARWCVSGLQGALLSVFLKPVYFSSLVLGSLLHNQHMNRALCGRIENHISGLPPPYRLSRPVLAQAASTENRSPGRAPSFSVSWACTDPHPEFLNATTGKLECGQPSVLCKQSMFARWMYLAKRLPRLQLASDVKPVEFPIDLDGLLYSEAKLLCPTYQAAKQHLFEAFDKAKLGRWIKKPLEQDQFFCELLDADPRYLFA